MTFEQLVDTTNEFRRCILKGNARFIQERKHGVTENRYTCTRDLLYLHFLNKLMEANERLTVKDAIVLPTWLPATLFDTLVSSILKRIK